MEDLITEALNNIEEDERAAKVRLLEELIKAGDDLSDKIQKMVDDVIQLQDDMELVNSPEFRPTVKAINTLKSASLCRTDRALSLAGQILGNH